MRWPAYVLVSSALTLSAQSIPGAGPNLYSRQKEAALGAQLAQQVRRTATPVDDATAVTYVERMGAKLAAQLPEPRFPYTFALIAGGNGDVLKEPVALPGGYVFVPTSLFLTSQEDREFAGMLAHAMAHVAERHGTRAATKNTIGQMPAIPAIANGGPAMLIPAAYVTFSRPFEQEADGLAVKMVSAAGYDAQGLIRYISREQTNNLPDSEARSERIAAMQNAIQGLPHTASGEFLQIQMQLRNPPRN
jgi:beta-barrel assembly-enhancing protease